MTTYPYSNDKMQQELFDKINASANRRYGGKVPVEVQKRITAEVGHISDNGHGTQLAVAAAVAEYSAAYGYPVSAQGYIGNLYIAYLLGITALDPMELGLHWEGCLGPDGTQMPEITLNVALELLNDIQAHLRGLFPDCDVLWGPGVPRGKIVIVPRTSGVYSPDNEYLTITVFPDELMSHVGEARCLTEGVDISDEDLIVRTYRTNAHGLPALGGWSDLQEFVNLLEPKTFGDLIKAVGVGRSYKLRSQAYRIPLLPDRFDYLVGTREDICDICVRLGISRDDAFRIMEQAVDGKLTQGYRDMLAAHGTPDVFLAVLDNAGDHLHPCGQLANEIYWDLALQVHRSRA